MGGEEEEAQHACIISAGINSVWNLISNLVKVFCDAFVKLEYSLEFLELGLF